MNAPRVQPEKFFSIKDVKRLFFASRSERWVKDAFKSGSYGAVLRDGGGWLVSEGAIVAYQARHRVSPAVVVRPRLGQLENLVQFAG